MQTHKFQADVHQVLHLVIHSLYSHKEIFLRELISNASDAIDRLRFRALTEPGLVSEGQTLEIRISADDGAGTLSVEDDGVGMSAEELAQNLGTIAHSGTRALLARLQAQKTESGQPDLTLIGQFGVGFYSAFLVADRVEVVSRAAGAPQAWRWTSSGQETFTVEEAERAQAGTTVTLHLKESERRFADRDELRELVRRYSDFVAQPIQLRKPAAATTDVVPQWELVNRGTALWQRQKSDISEAEYTELYKHLTHADEEPLARVHFRAEGTQSYVGLLYIPKKPPFDMQLQHRGVRLFVRRVFVMDQADDILPEWLRFVRGVVDSDDLPLNVSRESLQDSVVVRAIRRQLTKKVLEALEELAKERPADYALFWRGFGAVLKTGLHLAGEHKERVAALLRFTSTHDGGEGLSSLADYVARMKEGQKAIYYVCGDSYAQLAHGPHLESLRARGLEVLVCTDPIDDFAMESLRQFQDKPLQSAMRADLDLGEAPAGEAATPAAGEALSALMLRMRSILQERIEEVRASQRLTASPLCLVLPRGALHASVERVLRSHGHKLPQQKRILEVNGQHALIQRLAERAQADPIAPELGDAIELLYAEALIAEGTPLPDPATFAARLNALLLK